MKTTLTDTVGEWVTQYPQTSRVFESLKIDYCCGGKVALENACRDRGLDSLAVLEQLKQVVEEAPQQSNDWSKASLSSLCDHIEQTHHAYLKRELPLLHQMVTRVLNAHGGSNPDLATLAVVFQEFCAELEPHMRKEEKVLFPAIRQLEQSTHCQDFAFGSVSHPIRAMEQEHDHAGDSLSKIRTICNDFAVPPNACNTFRAMLHGLQVLEVDMHQHVHKENSILFPRAIQREESLTK